jgi:hypothetical protein
MRAADRQGRPKTVRRFSGNQCLMMDVLPRLLENLFFRYRTDHANPLDRCVVRLLLNGTTGSLMNIRRHSDRSNRKPLAQCST